MDVAIPGFATAFQCATLQSWEYRAWWVRACMSLATL